MNGLLAHPWDSSHVVAPLYLHKARQLRRNAAIDAMPASSCNSYAQLIVLEKHTLSYESNLRIRQIVEAPSRFINCHS